MVGVVFVFGCVVCGGCVWWAWFLFLVVFCVCDGVVGVFFFVMVLCMGMVVGGGVVFCVCLRVPWKLGMALPVVRPFPARYFFCCRSSIAIPLADCGVLEAVKGLYQHLYNFRRG